MSRPPPSADRHDPTHDPLVARGPGQGQAYAPTWWVASAGTPPDDDGPVQRDMDVDVAIVGSGATGLSTALYLAQEQGIRAVVLEANQVAWGCSSRSGFLSVASSEPKRTFKPAWRKIWISRCRLPM